MSHRRRLRGLFALARPGNAVAAGLLAFVGAFVAGSPTDPRAAVAIGATAIATAGGTAVNDYVDRDIDRRNRPGRPIPSGAVAPRTALAAAAALFVVAAGLALQLPRPAVAIAVGNVALLATYTSVFKRLPGVGNAVVAWLTGSAFLFGAAAVGRPFAAGTLAVLAGGATFAREVVKDAEDVEGDRAEGVRTLPTVVGRRRAVALAAVVLAAAVVASPLPYVDGTLGPAYLVGVVAADGVMLAAIATSFDDPAAGQRRLKIGMLLAAGAFVVGRATV
jgi:geranylgeranylglycerol-phosphate geranylgeranyltransferase